MGLRAKAEMWLGTLLVRLGGRLLVGRARDYLLDESGDEEGPAPQAPVRLSDKAREMLDNGRPVFVPKPDREELAPLKGSARERVLLERAKREMGV